MICYVDLHAGVLSSLLTVASKHNRTDSTALPNENGQHGVGLLQINIVAFTKLPIKKTHYRPSYIRVSSGFTYSLATRSLDTRDSATATAYKYVTSSK